VDSFIQLTDAVLSLSHDDGSAAERHFHNLMAMASEHGLGLLWIDAIEGLAVCLARAGAEGEALRLSGAAESARNERAYLYRYPYVSEMPIESDEGVPCRRRRPQRVRAGSAARATPSSCQMPSGARPAASADPPMSAPMQTNSTAQHFTPVQSPGPESALTRT
jgi:hypothetical protein